MATEAPANPNAVAKTAPAESAIVASGPRAEDLDKLIIRDVHGRLDLEKYDVPVVVPADFQYTIPKWEKIDGKWQKTVGAVGLTSSGYEYLNRVLGASFFLPDMVPDESGNLVRNPIRRRNGDYFYLRMAAVWYSPIGQLVMATEDIEVDFMTKYIEDRLNAKGAVLALGKTGPELDANGNFVITGLDADAELKAAKALQSGRTFGIRYAQTVVRVRLLKMALGIRQLPDPNGYGPRQRTINVVGFRDKMDPRERQKLAGENSEAIFGRPAEVQSISADEMREVEREDVDDAAEKLDREILDREPVRGEQMAISHPDAEPPEG